MLVAVQLNDMPVISLLANLPLVAVFDVLDVQRQDLDLVLVVVHAVPVEDVLLPIVEFVGRIDADLLLGDVQSFGVSHDGPAEGLDGDELVRVDVDLLLVALLVDEYGVEVECVDCLAVVSLWRGWRFV